MDGGAWQVLMSIYRRHTHRERCTHATVRSFGDSMTSSFNFYLKHCKRFLLLLLTALPSVSLSLSHSLFHCKRQLQLLQFAKMPSVFAHGIWPGVDAPPTPIRHIFNLNSNLFIVFQLGSCSSRQLCFTCSCMA